MTPNTTIMWLPQAVNNAFALALFLFRILMASRLSIDQYKNADISPSSMRVCLDIYIFSSVLGVSGFFSKRGLSP